MKPILSEPEINALIYGMHGAPFSLLGMHETGAKKPGVVVRTFRPYATKAEVVRTSDGQVFVADIAQPAQARGGDGGGGRGIGAVRHGGQDADGRVKAAAWPFDSGASRRSPS